MKRKVVDIDRRIERNRVEADRLEDMRQRLPRPLMAKAEVRDASKKRKAS